MKAIIEIQAPENSQGLLNLSDRIFVWSHNIGSENPSIMEVKTDSL